MLRADKIAVYGNWDPDKRCDAITLTYDERFRRRLRMCTDGGLEFLLDLPEARIFADGDGLVLDDGGIVLVRAAAEDLIEVRAANARSLLELTWHIGNRHLPAEIKEDCFLIRNDHVIVDMLHRLGAEVRPVRAPFNPVGGAYGQHNHDRNHPHAHGHRDE